MKKELLLGILLGISPVLAECEFSYLEKSTGSQFKCKVDEQDASSLCHGPDEESTPVNCKTLDGKSVGLHIAIKDLQEAVKGSCPAFCAVKR
ncbi:MAG: hypothetical protein H2057_06295 [Alphaproteobacteria bacterium]|nr:hypothetical protein [Alphaproteobacteria bacterium]